MPHVSKGSQVTRSGVHNNVDRDINAQPALARDNVNGAFAGDENSGAHSSKVKSRQTEKSKARTPVR